MGDPKQKVGNKARVESSLCNAYLMEKNLNFCPNYFNETFDTKSRDWGRNVTRCEQVVSNADIPDVFSMNIGHAPSQGNIRYLDDRDFRVTHAFVLSNCGILKLYERYAFLALLSEY